MRNEAQQNTKDDSNWWEKVNHFSQIIHQSLELKEVAYAVANDGRNLIECDRLSVLYDSGRGCRAIAISGQDTLNSRSNVVRLMESLAKSVVWMNQTLVHPNNSDDLPPQLEDALQAYVDQSHAIQIAIVPLSAPKKAKDDLPQSDVVGAIVAEQFSGEQFDNDRVTQITSQAATALGNVREYRSIFLMPVFRAIGKLSWIVHARTLPRTIAVLLLLAAIVIGLCVIPADFTVTAEGTLQPKNRQFIFAPADGVIDRVKVRHRSEVHDETVLVEMRSSAITLQLKEIDGQIDAASKRQTALNASRTGGAELTPAKENQLAAEEQELEQWLASLREQQKLLIEQQNRLTIYSPVDGEVITWDVQELLRSRPVRRGQALMTVADLDGPWLLELHVLDKRVGHLRDAQIKLGEDLDVSYTVATNPGRRLSGKVGRVAQTTSLDDHQQLGVLVHTEITESDIEQLRPGARVIAKIHCGRHSIGYVWLHDAWEFIQTQILFRWF